MLCHCGSGQLYHECCGKYHKGQLPENALKLMRSRYCAFALNLPNYLIETTHPENTSYLKDKIEWKKSISNYSKHSLFDSLTIVEFSDGEQEAYVTFRAQIRQKGHDVSFTEKSKFLKLEGKWLYHSGIIEG